RSSVRALGRGGGDWSRSRAARRLYRRGGGVSGLFHGRGAYPRRTGLAPCGAGRRKCFRGGRPVDVRSVERRSRAGL
ncbi:MAG: hypothetical protein AAFP86_24550, partial [Planctomycetota bacterium]